MERDFRYIVVEGPIGVGKTSLARLLADDMQAHLVREKVEENPFLAKFYQDPERYALPTQLEFLLSRHSQQQELASRLPFRQNVVADYSISKDLIFARTNLDSDEYEIYRKLFAHLVVHTPRPDLVVYLQARVDVLLARVRRRACEYERRITPQYIERIAEAYREFFFDYEESPLLVVQCSEIDFVTRTEDTVDLIREIRQMGQGIQHYIPLGSR